MSFLFTHLIAAWGIGKVFEIFSKKKLSTYTWLFLLAGSIISDLDLLLDWTIGSHIHRTFTHSLAFVLLMPSLLYLLLWLLNDNKKLHFSIALGMGIATHLLLDMFYPPGIALLWPAKDSFSYYGVVLIKYTTVLFQRPAADLVHFLKEMLIDTSLGAAWLFGLGWAKRIKF